MSSDASAVRSIAAGPYRATITTFGASLLDLYHDNRPLVLNDPDATVPTPPYRGAVLAPWPNRIRDGRYRRDDQWHQLPINEVGRGNALHGLVLHTPWSILDAAATSLTLATVIVPQPGYPFALRCTVRYEIDADGLAVRLATVNIGDSAAPYGASIHPYLLASPELIDTWVMELPADQILWVDDRLTPMGTKSVSGTDTDFRVARPLRDTVLDHAYTAIRFDDNGAASARLIGPNGEGVVMSWDATCRWLQVYTLHQPQGALHRRAVAIEPMTCAPNAFQTGEGLVLLDPGQQHDTTWRLSALAARSLE